MTTAASPSTIDMPNWASGVMSTADALQACAEACAGWQQEVAHFVDLRWAHNRESWETFLKARDVPSVMKAQQEWLFQAASDYTSEANRLAHLVTTISLTGTTNAVQEVATLVA